MGYRLSDFGLEKTCHSLPGPTKYNCPTEEDVFEALKLPYKSPTERD